MSSMLNMFRVTRNFILKEFESPDTREVKLDALFVVKLQMLRDKLTSPVIITSGYRTPEHNEKVGGVENSRHMFGRAADIIVRDVDSVYVRETAASVGFDTIKYYPETGHFHLDIRGE